MEVLEPAIHALGMANESTTTLGLPAMPEAPRVPRASFRMFQDASDFDRLADLAARVNSHDGVPWMPTARQLQTEMAASRRST